MFGEGLHWAALTIITILGQQYRFHSLDFSYHLLRVFDEKPKDGISCGIVSSKDNTLITVVWPYIMMKCWELYWIILNYIEFIFSYVVDKFRISLFRISLSVYNVLPKTTCPKFQSIKKLVDRIRHIQLMNNRILSVLNKYNSSDGSVTSTVPLEEVKYFPPPIRNIQ